MDIYLQSELDSVKRIDQNKRYWFIRTFAGEAFDYYYEESFVGLGLNHVPLSYIRKASKRGDKGFLELQSFIAGNTDYKKASATKWANQLISFVQDIGKGDTVIIPSSNSEKLAFGTIASELYLVNNPKKITHRGRAVPLPEKRYKVDWHEVIWKEDLLGNLKNLLSSHQGLTNADDYFEVIEGAMENMFIRDGFMYLVLQIGQDEDINAFHLQRFLYGLTYFYKEFCIANNIPDNEDLTIKIKLQSKGQAFLKGAAIIGLIGVAGIFALSNNAEVDLDLKNLKLKAKSDGGLRSMSEFLKEKQEREIEWRKFQDSIQNLKAQRNPDLSIDTSKENTSNGTQEFSE